MRQDRYRRELDIATEAALAAGKVLSREFHRPGGPRGGHGHCPADDEAEALIRDKLEAEFPSYGIRGEELPQRDRPPEDPENHVWLIDPNDGTSAFLKGWRGAAVSIALMRHGLPVLGVVYAHSVRAGEGDLIAWAEGLPLLRNGSAVDGESPSPRIVIVSQAGDENTEANVALCAPARFRAEPSIAYRLALVAAGEAAAAVSLSSPTDWDVAAGHALLRAVGGDLYQLGGQPVVYDLYGRAFVGDCVGGVGEFAIELSKRDWHRVFKRKEAPADPYGLAFPARDQVFNDVASLSRAQGCLMGQLAGDNLGALVEFQPPESITRNYPGGPRLMSDGGCWNLLAGQPTDDSELALMLARSILMKGRYDREEAAIAYGRWYGSKPFDIGSTTWKAFEPAHRAFKEGLSASDAAARAAAGNTISQSNGGLMRVSPLAIYGHSLDSDTLSELAREDAALSHAHPVCQDANAIFCVAVATAIREHGGREGVYRKTLDWGISRKIDPAVIRAVERAEKGAPGDFMSHQGWVLTALQNAFFQLLHAPGFEDGVVATVASGGDTDTNAAIAGALLGAVYGAEAIPPQWVESLLTSRPMEGTDGCRTPRPKAFWPVDCRIVAEKLLVAGASART